MAREIQQGSSGAPPDDYIAKLYKIIPTEITAAYLTIANIAVNPKAPSPDDIWYILGSAVVLLIAVPFYLYFLQGVRNTWQIVVSTLSFPIWAANIGYAYVYDQIPIPQKLLSILLILWTLAIPFAFQQKPQPAAP